MFAPARALTVGRRGGRLLRPCGRLRQKGLFLLLQLVDPPDAGDQLVPAEGLDQELAGPRLHRPPEIVALALDGHDDDRRPRGFLGQHLGRLDAVHDRHVDVHEDDVRHDLLGLLDAFFAIDGGGDHLDVGLEREQLLEVIQGAGDVVHDQDFDWLAHLVISLKKAPREIFRFRGEPVNVFFLAGLADVVGFVEGVDVRDAGRHLGYRVVLHRP